jgi:hypothetical protein
VELEIKKPKPNGASSKLSAVQKPCDKMIDAIVVDAGKRGQVVKAGGWLPLARMFIPKRDLTGGPVVVLFDKLEVIGGYSISDPMMEGHDSARLSVRYSYLGDIDYKSLSFSRPPPSPTAKVRRNYHLLIQLCTMTSARKERKNCSADRKPGE